MIKPEELRIGNWFTKDGEYHNVGHIQKNFYNICVNNYGPENINPIPLTPEILEAVGFDKEKELVYVLKKFDQCHVVLIQRLDVWMLHITGPFGMVQCSPIQHLHNLQNFIYSISGKELEVKLPQLV